MTKPQTGKPDAAFYFLRRIIDARSDEAFHTCMIFDATDATPDLFDVLLPKLREKNVITAGEAAAIRQVLEQDGAKKATDMLTVILRANKTAGDGMPGLLDIL